MAVQFGPDNATFFQNYKKWSLIVKSRGLILVGASNGAVAQDGPYGTCWGFWSYNLRKGWIQEG